MPRSRRALLSTLTAAGLTLAGCIGRPGSPADGSTGATATPPSTPTDPPPSTSADASGTTTAGPTSDGAPRGPVRGEGEPTSLDRTVRDGDFEYLPERDAVRYVAKYERGTPVYSSMSFEQWGEIQTASAGADRVRSVLAERLDDMEGIGTGVSGRREDLSVSVSLNTTRNREGEVITDPSVSFEELVEATPRSVDATVRLADREHHRVVGVWVEGRTLRLA